MIYMSSLNHCCKSSYLKAHFGAEKWNIISSWLSSDDLTILVFSFLPDEEQIRKRKKIFCKISNWWICHIYWNITDIRQFEASEDGVLRERWVMERADRFELSAWFWEASKSIQGDIFKKLQYEMVSDLIRDGKVRLIESNTHFIKLEDKYVPLIVPDDYDDRLELAVIPRSLYYDESTSESE